MSKASKAASKVSQSVASLFGGAKTEDHPYRMLIIGETGSGKTSLLNLFCNCGMIQALQHSSFEDLSVLRGFNDIKLENASFHKMESKTSGAKVYSAILSELKMGIIDTPGFGDSRGMKQDKLNTKSIIDVLRDEEYVNCVCLVINGRQARLSANLQYVLSEVTAILPKNVIGNVIVVFTNTADPLDCNFELGELKVFFGRAVEDTHTFYIENPYCRLEKAKLRQGQLPTGMIAKSLKKNFEDTAQVLEGMCQVMKDFKRVHTHDFISLYEKKQEVEKGVVTLLVAYDNQQRIEKAIKRAQDEAETAFKKKALNANFTSMQTLKVVELVQTDRHNTLCAAAECTSNCHDPCNLEKSVDKSVFKSCACMQGGEDCVVCGHHYTYHYHFEQRYEEVVKEKQFVDESMKQKFHEASTMEERAQIFKENNEAKLRSSERKRKELSGRLLRLIEEFQKLGMTRNYTKVVENQVAVINLRLEGTSEPEKMQDLRQTKEELEKKLKLVRATMNEPFSSGDTNWARTILELNQHVPLTKDKVTKAFKKLSKTEHPDKGGDTDHFQRLERARQILFNSL